MIPYQDWIARGTAVCDAECAEAMGYVWRDCRPGGPQFWYTQLGERAPFLVAPEYTTDRNHTAMMAEEVVAGGVSVVTRFNKFLSDCVPYWPLSPLDAWSLAPSLVAYCARRALREEA